MNLHRLLEENKGCLGGGSSDSTNVPCILRPEPAMLSPWPFTPLRIVEFYADCRFLFFVHL